MIQNERFGPHVHVKPDGEPIARFLRRVAMRVWIPDPSVLRWRSIIER